MMRHLYQKSDSRRGAAAILIIVMISALVIMAAISIDFSYMQLVRTELRTATDAAAKAGAEALGRTQNIDTAKQEAIRYAAANKVGGRPFRIGVNDLEIGRVIRNDAGRWNFTLNGSPPNAMRVNARSGGTALQSAIPLYFGQVLGTGSFAPSYQAIAGQQDVEVCLCLDRSGSMLFDMSGNDFEYPPNNPRLSSFTGWGTMWQNHLSPPHPTSSRWAVLARAVNLFFDEAVLAAPQPRIGLVTWGSDYDMPISPYTHYNESQIECSLPASSGFDFDANKRLITGVVADRGTKPMMGGTNLSAGLSQAITVLRGSNSNAFASKVVILLTDGAWNVGADPATVAAVARSNGIIVHCVSMLTSTQPTLQNIATTTNGRYFSTSNEAELRAAFQELARSLPVVLTD